MWLPLSHSLLTLRGGQGKVLQVSGQFIAKALIDGTDQLIGDIAPDFTHQAAAAGRK
jgi:hypothetical protein